LAKNRWREIFREFAGKAHRELRITLTPVVRPQKWLFIVGCYNSGTELLENILAKHPDVAGLPEEGQFLTDQIPADYEIGLPRMWVMREDLFRLTENDEGPDVDRLKKEWIMRLDRSRPVFVEKSPPNAAKTRWLQKHFENAHFIAIVRNGYAVAAGIRRKAEPYHLKEGWPLDACAHQWARSYEVLLEDAQHLKKVLWVRYEDLTANPAAEIKRVLEFAGLQVPDLDGFINQSYGVHERNEPIRNMNPESIARLSAEEKRIVTEQARPMLERFGYEILS
jgi:hypothetical protein